MKTKFDISINVKATFDNWDSDSKISESEMESKVNDFIKGYFPMYQTTLGNNSGRLEITLESVNCNIL